MNDKGAVVGEVVRVEVSDLVATVTLDRPDKLNAMSPEVFAGLAAAGRRAGSDPNVRAVVIRGEGRAFSSGLDLSSLGRFGASDGPTGVERAIAAAQAGFRVWSRIDKPVIAAVQGYAFGAGFQLALAADIRIAADDAVFGMLEITYGLVPDLGGTHRLPKLVGPGRAKELIWTARRIDAGQAEAWGLVNRVVARDDLDTAAKELASDIASRPPLPVGYAKRLVDRATSVDLEEGMDGESYAQLVCLLSADMREAVSAAFEKRPGSYRGA